MAGLVAELNERFAPHDASLPEDVLAELQSILRLHSTTPQELFYKWESYSIKMGSEDGKLDLKTVRDFKKDIQEALERETRSKHIHAKPSDRRGPGATPRNASGADMFDMMDGVSPATPRLPMSGVNGNSVKRKNKFDTPAAKTSKSHAGSSPHGPKDTPMSASFSERQNAGQFIEHLNAHLEAIETREVSFSESRIKLKAGSDLSKFAYKPMSMKLSGASEILDDRIDGFLDIVQQSLELEDSAFGNPAGQSSEEIIAVGRIASDTSEGKLNSGSVVLETSRRTGGGLRVPLKLDAVKGYDVFPGKIIALKGTNPTGDAFSVSAIVDAPLAPVLMSTVDEMDGHNARLTGGDASSESPPPLTIVVSAGPYTSDDNLAFEPLHALCEKARSSSADALILLGPFLDIEHPLLAAGDLPSLGNINPDTATLTDVFRALISSSINRLVQSLPHITILLIPSVRDAVHKHISYPQDRLKRIELGLPKNVAILPNPVMISLNEMLFAISTLDVLTELKQESLVSGTARTASQGVLERTCKYLIEQRHFFPLYPAAARDTLPKPTPGLLDATPRATGAMLDLSYLALCEWGDVRPDVLVTPSALAPFARVVESVVCINPGTLAKKRGTGSCAVMSIGKRAVNEDERESDGTVEHRVFDRARVDVVKI